MSKTPRTDFEADGSLGLLPKDGQEWVDADFARQLETELAEARAEAIEIGRSLAEKEDMLSDALSHRDELFRLANAAQARSNKKDKLVEQMQEALQAADIKLHGICLSCNKLIGMRSIKTLIKAALEAAGRENK